ncbi:MAG TPA: YggT family protein [Chloroflexota bacterium]|jgi:YggT family protein|nr:YggT family protein [Chloroflexota bacterium]
MPFNVFVFAIQFVNLLVQALVAAIILRAIFSWFVPPTSDNVIFRILRDVTEPLLSPIRRVVPSMGALDLSPFVAVILLQLMGSLVVQTLLQPLALAR